MIRKIYQLLKNRTESIYAKDTFSLNGEDIIIDSYFNNISRGFYLDVGAHHPFRFSNTYLLHKKGWHGLNIDASAESIALLNKFRRTDINVEAAISDKEEFQIMHTNKLGALNTLDQERLQSNFSKYTGKREVKTYLLSNIIEKYLPKNQREINFLNIDVEGFDLKALSTFPWSKYRPELVCVEDLTFNPNSPERSEIFSYMEFRGYTLYAVLVQTLFFKPV